MENESLRGVDRLLVRGLNWIGDAVMSLPTIWNIRQTLPDIWISAAAPGWCADLYRICPAIDEVIEIPHKSGALGIGSEWEFTTCLQELNVDAALILPNSFRSALAPFLARIGKRLGYSTGGRKPLLTGWMDVPEEARKQHTVLYYRPLLAELGVDWSGERFDVLLSDTAVGETREILNAKGVDDKRIKAGFSPGAAWGEAKRWPPGSFAEAATRLVEKAGVQPLFFGSEDDSQLVESILRKIPAGGINLSGAFPKLRHLVAAIAECDLLVTNDSGPMHIAAAVGTPVVALFGPTDERRSGPWSVDKDSVVILRAPGSEPCYNLKSSKVDRKLMEGIEADDVVKAALTMLARERRG